MPSELVRSPPSLPRPARSLLTALDALGPALLWRALHPLARERFLAAPEPAPLTRVPVVTRDGWTLDLRELRPAPGGAGEPVLLLPTLASGGDVFRCGGDGALADRLAAAGFHVFLGAHRGTVDGVPPDAAAAIGFDDVVEVDLPAVLDAIVARTGYARVHVVGHGFGGQLALAAAARRPDAALATVAVLSAPVLFPTPPPALRRLAAVAGRLPTGWRLPARHLARWSAALVEPGATSGRRRAALAQGAEDVPLGLLGQVSAWLEAGSLCDRAGGFDYRHGLSTVRAPLWMGLGDGDGLCPASWALPLRDAWSRGPVTVHRWDVPLDHLDVLLHPDAGEAVLAPLVAWLVRQRARAWT